MMILETALQTDRSTDIRTGDRHLCYKEAKRNREKRRKHGREA